MEFVSDAKLHHSSKVPAGVVHHSGYTPLSLTNGLSDSPLKQVTPWGTLFKNGDCRKWEAVANEELKMRATPKMNSPVVCKVTARARTQVLSRLVVATVDGIVLNSRLAAAARHQGAGARGKPARGRHEAS